ncbi:glycosyltransferase family 2 protein [Subtercola frigoramans]|uniref:Glycosyltransferase 2-like domain-containing protein n=1 Tax=Subtercola frigoramans TaxID=120298 RepID=A0ABS2L8K4_9MICO|nr:glycosyltransferase family A protein [Subtercola frigoramans]MBM7473425.1 hypothetical protein [Subtercola frigoramans]
MIPTIGRSELRRAVDTALAQSIPPFQVIVVADTADQIDVPESPSVRVLRVGPRAGGNVARQQGIYAAETAYVALLDDDDEWLPNHLANFAELVRSSGHSEDSDWIFSSPVIARYSDGASDEVWPSEAISRAESIAQYLFRKHKVRGGIGFAQASTLVFPRSLGIEIPFNPGFKFHQDVGWLNQISKDMPEVELLQPAEPAVIHHISAGGVSKSITAPKSIAWAVENLDPEDKRTIGDFISVHSMQAAKNQASLNEMFRTLRTAHKLGKPGIPSTIYSVALTGRVALGKIGRH